MASTYDHDSTIVALASAAGEAGLAVIRLSGTRAFAVATQVFKGDGFSVNPVHRYAVYGILLWPDCALVSGNEQDRTIDKAVVLPFVGPSSYTGEDTVEFYCHGGPMVVKAVLAACRAAGAEPATAGEFTRRAFLNGKLTLDQAEAVADLIHAQSPQAATAAIRQLTGGLDEQLRMVEAPLLRLLAQLEGALEFVAEEEIEVSLAEIQQTVLQSTQQLEGLLRMAPAGRFLRDGIHVVLAGPPNAGKSSLFNNLLTDERAIVDAEAGTTRDVISGRCEHNGSFFVFHDTAGLRDDPGRIEGLGIERAWREVAQADVVLALSPAGDAVFSLASETSAPVISVVTQRDLLPDFRVPEGAVFLSNTTGSGLDKLWDALEVVVREFRLHEAVSLGVVLNERHLHRLSCCRDDLKQLGDDVARENMPDEVIGTLLASILCRLGEVSGRVFSESLLESVFKRFCVGK